MNQTEDVARVVTAARSLGELPARERRWTHLSLCVLDAVFSIGARYPSTTRVVRAYAQLAELPHTLEQAERVAAGHFAATEEPVSALRDRIDRAGPDAFARQLGNRQRTSTRGGVLKAAAAREFANILAEHRVERLADVPPLLCDSHRVAAVEQALAQVPGHGQHGIRVSYLWMLSGDDQHVKPDRMVVGWLSSVLGRPVLVGEASALVSSAAAELGVTPWSLDHALWSTQRSARTR